MIHTRSWLHLLAVVEFLQIFISVYIFLYMLIYVYVYLHICCMLLCTFLDLFHINLIFNKRGAPKAPPTHSFYYIIGPCREATFVEHIFNAKVKNFMREAKKDSYKTRQNRGHLYFPLYTEPLWGLFLIYLLPTPLVVF